MKGDRSMERLPKTSPSIVDENIRKIQELFPAAVTETKDKSGKTVLGVDFDVLAQELSKNVIGAGKERYQMTWPGKKEAVILSNAQTENVIRPVKNESINFEKTKNIYIEGDNLEVLKILRETYLGTINVIYIDPPYNTGKDFIYKDSFASSSEEYLKNAGLKDENENQLVANPNTSGKYHSNWLNMMYPRIRLAKDFLTEDGVIFISIGDDEFAQLKILCDEVFGSKNFIGDSIWESNTQPTNAGRAKFGFQRKIDHTLLYARKKECLKDFVLKKKNNNKQYPNVYNERQCRFEIIEKSNNGRFERQTMQFSILGQKPRKGKRWQIGEAKARELEANGRLINDNGIIKKVVYPEDEEEKDSFVPFWGLLLSKDAGTAMDGKRELIETLGFDPGFDTVKPVEFMKEIISHFASNCKFMDFFSGTATLAQAIYELNEEDLGNRQFILIQIPEEIKVPNHPEISDLCQLALLRLKNCINSIQSFGSTKSDLGLRVFKVDSPNFKEISEVPSEYSLIDKEDNVKSDRNGLDLLTQVMLQENFSLSSPIEVKELPDKSGVFYLVNGTDLLCCFEKNISESNFESLANYHSLFAVFRDSSFSDDASSVNCEQIFKTLSPNTRLIII